ncbi:MAG: ATP-dependent DNA helicase [Candidatus Gottesmanbacteria bacterium]
MSEEKKLNKEQLEAAQYGNGPLLIIAGAGTGKTTVITERIKWLVSQGKARPAEILALTFTEKAAREMEERVDMAMPMGFTQMWISTFHSFCDRILRAEALHIGLDPRYNLLTQAETIQFLKQNLFKFELQYFRPLGNPTKFIDGMLQHFSRLKDEDVNPNEYLRWVNGLTNKMRAEVGTENFVNDEVEKYIELANAYKLYEELKIKEGVMDFADLIANTLKLFRTRPNVLKQYQNQFKFMLVDEFQDTNFAQYALIKLLAPPDKHPNLAVVGDDSQSIYKFRGAAISNILQFMDDFKKAKQVVLNDNYRSTQTILDHAYKLIKNNDPDTLEVKLGISKNLKKTRNVKEVAIDFIHTDRVENEAELAAREINKLINEEIRGLSYKDIAILIRANNQADSFIRSFARHNIPYQFLGPGMLFRQAEVKDLIAYLKLLVNFEDSVATYRILAMEIFDINPRDLAAISNYSRRYHLSLFEACEQIGKIFVTQKTKDIIEILVKMINHHLSLIKKETAGQILYYFLEDTGLLKKITNYNNTADERKAQNISKFFDKLKTYEVNHEDASVFVVSDWIDLSMELGESPLAADIDWNEIDAVNILTVHSSKGLEFPIVFLVNLVSQRFPTIERREQIPIPDALIKEILPVGDFHLEEERRLFYVGMTRARDRLYLTAADYYGEGKREKKISPFVIETLGEKVVSSKYRVESNKQLSLLEWKKSEVKILDPKPSTLNPINYLTYSMIQTFKECPMHFKARYILGIPTPPTSALSFGSSLHAALRDFYRLRSTNQKSDEDFLMDLYQRNWINEGYKDKKHEQLTFAKGKKFLRSFLKEKENLLAKPVAIEQPFKFRLGDLTVAGKVDRMDLQEDDTVEIIDYKTGANVSKQADVDKDLQLSIYALAATQVQDKPFGKTPQDIRLSLYYFETGEKLKTTKTKEQLEQTKQELLDWQKKISASDFKCHLNDRCKNCEYNLLCEAV